MPSTMQSSAGEKNILETLRCSLTVEDSPQRTVAQRTLDSVRPTPMTSQDWFLSASRMHDHFNEVEAQHGTIQSTVEDRLQRTVAQRALDSVRPTAMTTVEDSLQRTVAQRAFEAQDSTTSAHQIKGFRELGFLYNAAALQKQHCSLSSQAKEVELNETTGYNTEIDQDILGKTSFDTTPTWEFDHGLKSMEFLWKLRKPLWYPAHAYGEHAPTKLGTRQVASKPARKFSQLP
ncbi:hypothetical protein Bbelb_166630 [Branchiostoma belcheri]|nr:hypothetical protein Bbelb_166630 [Branchiostoma belcheri]